MARSKRVGVLAAAVLMMTVAACGGGDGGSSATSTGPEPTSGSETTVSPSSEPAVPTAGGELTVGRGSSLFGWQGDLSLNAAMFQTLNMVYGNLVTLDETGTALAPGLAEAFDFDPSAPSITLTLRPGLLFSDGSALTSADVAFSVDQWKAGPINGGIFADIVRTETPDDLTIILDLSRPNVYILNVLATAIATVYPEDFAGKTAEEFGTAPIGARSEEHTSELQSH